MEDICGQVHLSLFVFIKCIAECEFVILIKITTLCHSFLWQWVVFSSECEDVQVCAVADSINRRGWDPNNRFNPSKLLCLSFVRTWMFNAICRGFYLCSMS